MIALAYKRLLQLGKVAGAITFLFGIPYGIFEFWQKQKADEVEQTLSLFKQFNSAPITSYRENISKALAKNKDELAKSFVSAETQKAVVLKVIEQEGIEKDLLLMMDFFDGVVVCVLKNICDADTTEKLFQRRAGELYANFYPYIKERRDTVASKTFAIGLQTVATPKHK